jgi:trans-aconitate methyltransferase
MKSANGVNDGTAARTAQNEWEAGRYDAYMPFVSQGGIDLIGMLDAKPGAFIIDWGCGTGDLAARIAANGAEVLGVDFSREMVEEAKRKYPAIRFEQADGQRYVSARQADAVFSNAALHWMQDAEGAAASIAASLRVGGRFVAEFGSEGNIAAIREALEEAYVQIGAANRLRFPWYFPSVGQYATVLEQQGMRIEWAACFDRPTPLEGGERGLQIWLDTFANGILAALTSDEERDVRSRTEAALRQRLYADGRWTADYQRIRVSAVKR